MFLYYVSFSCLIFNVVCKLEGTAHYAGQLLAPVEGFGLRPRLFLPGKKRLNMLLWPTLDKFWMQTCKILFYLHEPNFRSTVLTPIVRIFQRYSIRNATAQVIKYNKLQSKFLNYPYIKLNSQKIQFKYK